MEKILYFKTPSVNGATLTPVSNLTVKAINIETQEVYIFAEIEQTGNYKADLPVGNYRIWDNSKGTMNDSGSLVVAGSIHNAFDFNTLPVGYEYMTVFQKTYDDLLASGRWVLLMGQQYPIATYSELYQIVGSCHSTAAEISAGNFRIADMRGVFMRFINQGIDGIWADTYYPPAYGETRADGVGTDNNSIFNRAIGTKQYESVHEHFHGVDIANDTGMLLRLAQDYSQTPIDFPVKAAEASTDGVKPLYHNGQIIAPSGFPKNISVAPLIKILP